MRRRLVGGGAGLLGAAVLGLSLVAVGQTPAGPSPAEVRQQAAQAGMGPLSSVPVPQVPNLGDFVQDREAAVLLGKALFWDMAVGSDGQACASCHFHAGVDNRTKNQLNPGSGGTGTTFGDNTVTGAVDFPRFGPNVTVTEADFPFTQFADPGNRHSPMLRDTDDVLSSTGVFNRDLKRVVPLKSTEQATSVPDPLFNVDGVNVRRVEPRHTPSIFNAVFNFHNFWDGRAHNSFNGVSPFGPLDDAATILVNEGGRLVERKVRLPNSSLASQAVGPPLSVFEMSASGRVFPDLGHKLLLQRPLHQQLVHPKDSVLGKLSLATFDGTGRLTGMKGLRTTYGELVKKAFRPEYWSGSQTVTFDGEGRRVIPAPPGTDPQDRYSQLEANFSLFFGLAIQLYESTLVSDQTPFDRFMAGDDGALDATQLQGLQVFATRGGCSACHAGPEFTLASVTLNNIIGPILVLPTLELAGTNIIINPLATTFEDTGFFNIGLRPTGEDPGRGGLGPNGRPLSASRQALLGLPEAPTLPCGGSRPPCPAGNRDTGVEGAFKAPGLRNVALTGPYFHTGGVGTLGEVVDFYRRQGNFTDANIRSVSLGMGLIRLLPEDREPLVRFLQSLTDERVRQEQAPFDHPQLFVPNGHPGDQDTLTCVEKNGEACDSLLEVPAVGAYGRPAAGLPPLEPFLPEGSPALAPLR